MPPKKATTAAQSRAAVPLTSAEQVLLRIASRLYAAIAFKAAHPNGDYSNWVCHFSDEMVRRKVPSMIRSL